MSVDNISLRKDSSGENTSSLDDAAVNGAERVSDEAQENPENILVSLKDLTGFILEGIVNDYKWLSGGS
jgi:hypothetical protein